MSVICPNCSYDNFEGALFCSECGTKIEAVDEKKVITKVTGTKCETCNGTGTCIFKPGHRGCDGTGKCKVCNGMGKITGCFHCSKTGECQLCGGTGKCSDCNGKGLI